MSQHKKEKPTRRQKFLLVLGVTMLSFSFSFSLQISKANAQFSNTQTCPGNQQRPVPCRDYNGVEVADSYCALAGNKPTADQTCRYNCGIVGDDDDDDDDDGDPLILDLNSDGITLTCAEDGVRFDMDNDGIPDQTGWIDANDGFLVLDDNGNGTIDRQSELFGNNELTAFEELATFDEDEDGKSDGVIDADDLIWSQLQIWRDANQDGVSQANELHALSDFDINRFHLSFERTESESGENRVTGTGFFERASGVIGSVIEAFMRFFD